jgi:carbon storage regulator
MLVLTRRSDESIIIREDIVVTVLAIEGDRVKLGVSAPREISILRKELLDAVQEQNRIALRQGQTLQPAALERLIHYFANRDHPA